MRYVGSGDEVCGIGWRGMWDRVTWYVGSGVEVCGIGW